MMWSSADHVALRHGGRVVDGAEPEVAPQHLARQQVRRPGRALAFPTPNGPGRSRPGPSASGPSRCRLRTWRPAGPGKRSGTPDHSHSPAARSAFTGKTVGSSSNGRVGRGQRRPADAPVCRQTTVPVSSQAAKKGSQCPLKMEGSCSWAGNSGKLTALKPRAALARTSAAATATSASQGKLQRDDAVRVASPPTPPGASR